jgi:hypothetical protein
MGDHLFLLPDFEVPRATLLRALCLRNSLQKYRAVTIAAYILCSANCVRFLQIGEVYYYGTGTKDQCKGAMSDQFFLGDYLETVEDAEGYVMDLTMEMPVHLRNLLDPLCNAQMEPYPEPYQSAYQSERIRAFGGVEVLHGAGLPVPIARLVNGWTVLPGNLFLFGLASRRNLGLSSDVFRK